MNKTLSILILGALTSTNAFAMHAYRHEQCEAKVGKSMVQIKRDLSDSNGGINDSQLSTAYQGLVAVTGNALDAPSADADLQLEIISETAKASKKVNDGCFQGENGSFSRKAKVLSLSPEARLQLDVRADQTLDMTCQYENVEPVGPTCGE